MGSMASAASAVSSAASSVASMAAETIKQATSLTSQIKATMLYEPPLSFIGMQHAINLGNEYILKQNKNYDIYKKSININEDSINRWKNNIKIFNKNFEYKLNNSKLF